MPGYLLDVSSTVMCSHGGKATPTAPFPRVKVGGQPVLLQSCVYAVAGCAFPPPPAGNGPCVTANFITGSVRVKAGGMPILLQDSQAICTPTGTPLIIAMTQLRVKGM